MSEKLHNDEFDVKRTDGNVLSGDSNKIKLKITSYAVMMEVQEAYMKEEIVAKEKEKKDLEQQLENEDLSRKERREVKKNISYLADDLEIMTDVYAAFSKSRQRFMEIAKKALKLPEENLKQLAENGSIEIEGEKINIEEAMKETQSILTDTMENEDVFSSVDSDLIKQEVERAMNEEEKDEVTGKINKTSDFIESKLNENPDTFDDIVKTASAGVKENVDEVKKDEITFADADDIFNRARNITIESPKKAEKPLENIPTPLNKGIDFDFPTGEWTDIEGKTAKEETPNFDVPASPTNQDDSISFDNDSSIKDLLDNLERQNQELITKGEEIDRSISSRQQEQVEAKEKRQKAMEEREEAKRKAEETKKQIQLIESYKPRMEELRRANSEQERINREKEEQLKTETANLTSINLETKGYEDETKMYAEETSKYLEQLKNLRKEFTGETNDTQMTSGGRTM